MAKQFTMTVSVNGGASAQHTVLVKDDETNLLHPAILYRTWCALGLSEGDYFSVSAISGPSNASDPVGGFASIPWFQVITGSGGITLAFID